MLWTLPLLPLIAGAALIALPGRSRPALGALAAVALAATLAVAVLATLGGWSARLPWSETLVLTAALPPASAAVALLVPAIALPVVVYAAAHEHRPGLARLLGLLVVFVGGMELLVIAADLLTLLIGWELVGACSWALIGHDWRLRSNGDAGLYAFLVTRFGDLGLFLAAMAAYAGTGSFSYAALGGLEEPWLTVAAAGILLSAAAKSGQVPFAPWLFRAMAGPTSVSALLHAATMVAAGAFLLARLHPHLADAPGWSAAVMAVGLATALAGGVVACVQNHAKRVLAASTSAHYGLMMVAVGVGYPGVALLHLIAHAAFKALLFLAAGIAGERAGSFALDRMGFGRVLPWSAGLAAVGALALAGVLPLGAAWTKEAIATAAGHRSVWLAFAVMVAGGLSAVYATRFQVQAYGRAREPAEGDTPTWAERGALAALALLTLALSVLWLPDARAAAGVLLGADIPHASLAETVVSLVLVALGLVVGGVLARRLPALGTTGAPAAAAAWLGLPALIDATVTRPFRAAAAMAARIDDGLIDAVPRGLARGAAGLRRGLARGDRRVVDAGVEAAGAFGRRLARAGDRLGETLADGLPEGLGRVVAVSATDARRLQSGLSHHYYVLLAGGAGALILVILLLS